MLIQLRYLNVWLLYPPKAEWIPRAKDTFKTAVIKDWNFLYCSKTSFWTTFCHFWMIGMKSKKPNRIYKYPAGARWKHHQPLVPLLIPLSSFFWLTGDIVVGNSLPIINCAHIAKREQKLWHFLMVFSHGACSIDNNYFLVIATSIKQSIRCKAST